ncbi:SNF2-related protein [Rhizobium rhizogenes]|uniref:SNF2-related protein n=1 Tax=Rhizobium rhizogenes TaxID=359 RepID=UPI001572F05B|nr:SNF2-related protein [Rhizobium rhizogenes]NTF63415.1 DEAD/DEAH box helicase [Rhizobium rhizogenes]NTG94747.1 DEAD/DEAH box helicase [Rhizobium rhizogenes]
MPHVGYRYHPVQGQFFAHGLLLESLDEASFTRSLSAARVDMNPHQVEASLFALKSPLTKGVLLADEVGLGKTIEAGLVMAQKWAEQKRRILLIVPASLRKQWEQELIEKFGLPSTIMEASRHREMKKAGIKDPFETASGVVIASYEFAAGQKDELHRIRWDLVVFDEAHRLRNVYKKNGSQRAKDLKRALADPFKVLLTATPLQNSLLELFGIVSIIDDNHFGGEAAFKRLYMGTSTTQAGAAALKERLKPICHRTLRRQVQEAGHINFTKRNATVFNFDPPDVEVKLYNAISSFLQRKDTISYGERTNQLVILQIRKILGSSTFAVIKYLETLIERLEKKRSVIDTSISDDIETIDEIGEEFTDDDTDEDDSPEEPIDSEKLAAELVELRGFLILAQSIGANAKGEKLIDRLPAVLDAIKEKGGARKAVIFTESVRTQTYLAELLSSNGYSGEIVLLNGSNNDAASQQTYKEWKERHAGGDKISSSKTADMKAAIVEAFKSDGKSILIATESGAEGINLQFCSLVINFDLPWNPQRVEQRIGRCHRYGQKIDVTVVNMLNLKNQAELRIHQLLSEKFRLFQGVFGSSDEVLGSIERGVDFEKRVLDIVQQCRTPAEIDANFDALQAEMQETISAEVEAARAKVLEQFDTDVVLRLNTRKAKLAQALDDFSRRLLLLARAELPTSEFDIDGSHAFRTDGVIFTPHWQVATDNDWQFFRLTDDNLAKKVADNAIARKHGVVSHALRFNPALFPFDGQLADVAALKGMSGFLRVSKASVKTESKTREDLLVSCIANDGTQIPVETARRLLMAPAIDDGEVSLPSGSGPIDKLEDTLFEAFATTVKNQNFKWLEEEEIRLDNYAKDIEVEIDAQIDELEEDAKRIRRERRSPDISMEEKLSLGRKAKALEGEIDELKFSKHERRKEIRRQVNEMLDEFSASLNRKPELDHLFSLRWSVE